MYDSFLLCLPVGSSVHEFPAAAQGQPLIRLKVNQNKFQGVMDKEKHIHLYPAEGTTTSRLFHPTVYSNSQEHAACSRAAKTNAC